MTIYYVTKEKQHELSEAKFKRNLEKQIVKDTWYKLYMLQNYNISMNMFKGANLRYSSILAYLTQIRAITKGYKYKYPITKSLVNYINDLIEHDVQPYPVIDKSIVTIKELIDNGLLNEKDIKYIYNQVGITDENPDTSKAWTNASTEKDINGRHSGSYTEIVKSLPVNKITNPIKRTDLPKDIHENNPFKFLGKHSLMNTYKKAFNLV